MHSPTPRAAVLTALVSSVLLSVLAPSAASGRPMDGRFGVGLERTLGGASGLALRFFASDSFAIVATAGVDITIVNNSGQSDTSAGVAASLGGMLHLAKSEHAHLAVGARLTLGYRTLDAFRLIDPDATSTTIDVAIEIPIALEVWISNHFSLMVATGILIDFVPSSGAQLRGDGAGSDAPAGSIGIGLGAGSITATLGAMYYF